MTSVGTALRRSERFSGMMFHGRRGGLASILFWVLVAAGILLVVFRSLQGPSGSSQQRAGLRSSNGKFRHH